MSRRPEWQFPDGVDRHVQVGDDAEVVFGRDVLGKLVDRLRAAAAQHRTDRSWGPGVLGCTMWMDDPELIRVMHDMANVCIVVTKQPRSRYAGTAADALLGLANDENKGLYQRAYPELSELAARHDGKPMLVGPHNPPSDDNLIGAVREVGFRRVDNHLVPIVHAKILLLGQMHWAYEHPSGYAHDQFWMEPEQLWIGSANFTIASRASLEMGMWTSSPALLEAARGWLLTLIGMSEPLAAPSDGLDPELVPVEYDDAAIWEYLRDTGLSRIWRR